MTSLFPQAAVAKLLDPPDRVAATAFGQTVLMPDTDAPDDATAEQDQPDPAVRDPRASAHPVGEDQASENAENESPG